VDRLELVGSGRDADVFSLGSDRVLRRYREGGDATREAEIMAFVAEQGYPVPAVYDVDGADLVMERIDGPTMLVALGEGTLEIAQAARTLAQLQDRLHRLPGRARALAGDRVIHLDFHPENVMVGSRGPMVIDWRNATDGPPDLDVAMSAVILAQVAVDDGDGRAAPARTLLARFLEHTEGDPLRLLDEAVARRRANRTMTPAELDLLVPAEAVIRELA
jgi:aminoglycoside phosphotransferase (APT) family kinase protein